MSVSNEEAVLLDRLYEIYAQVEESVQEENKEREEPMDELLCHAEIQTRLLCRIVALLEGMAPR